MRNWLLVKKAKDGVLFWNVNTALACANTGDLIIDLRDLSQVFVVEYDPPTQAKKLRAVNLSGKGE